MSNIEQPLRKLQKINGYLLNNAKEVHPLGLMNGKLGLGIYFFHLARKTENQGFLETAENLVGEIFEKLSEAKFPTDFENGLAGIAWGLSYLVNSDFVEADLDDTLRDLDDKVYKYLEDQKANLPANCRNGILGYLIYSLDRLESSIKSGHYSNTYIFRKLVAGLLNQLGQLIEEEKFQDKAPQLFSIYWDLPLVLIVLAHSKRLQVNPDKVERILDYLLPTLLSLVPSLHSNKMYLLLGIETVVKEIDQPDLRKHALVLKRSINIWTIFNSECKSLNIHVFDGVSGLRLLGKKLFEITMDNSFLPSGELVFDKINNSIFLGEADFYSAFKKSIGLVSGLSGVAWTLLDSIEFEKNLKS